jgi:hypothetical protein
MRVETDIYVVGHAVVEGVDRFEAKLEADALSKVE